MSWKNRKPRTPPVRDGEWAAFDQDGNVYVVPDSAPRIFSPQSVEECLGQIKAQEDCPNLIKFEPGDKLYLDSQGHIVKVEKSEVK